MVPVYDKLIGLLMVIAGLVFIAFVGAQSAGLVIGGLVVMGGISAVVNAQAMAGIIGAAQKAGLFPLEGSPSAAGSSQPSAGSATDQSNGRA